MAPKNTVLPKVSIVIPCYNQGHFLQDALSGYIPENELYEIIIVNDGSTAPETMEALAELRAKGYLVIDQANAGLSAARNTGISRARGNYIMLLDADNKVELSFVEEAASILDGNADMAVVYSDAQYFGEKTGNWIVGSFNLQQLMIENYIDACAMVRRSVFEELGGYDTNMKKGWEDWEMWLRIAFSCKKFYYLPKTGFHYRVNKNSMVSGVRSNYKTRNEIVDYLHAKYPDKLGHIHITKFVVRRFRPNPFLFLTKLSMITWANKKYQKLVKEHKMINGI